MQLLTLQSRALPDALDVPTAGPDLQSEEQQQPPREGHPSVQDLRILRPRGAYSPGMALTLTSHRPAFTCPCMHHPVHLRLIVSEHHVCVIMLFSHMSVSAALCHHERAWYLPHADMLPPVQMGPSGSGKTTSLGEHSYSCICVEQVLHTGRCMHSLY